VDHEALDALKSHASGTGPKSPGLQLELVVKKTDDLSVVHFSDGGHRESRTAESQASQTEQRPERGARPSEEDVPYRRCPQSAEEKKLAAELLEELDLGAGEELLERALAVASRGYVTEMQKPIRTNEPDKLYKSLQKQLELDGRKDDLAHVTEAAEFLNHIKLPPLESGSTDEDMQAGFERKTALFGMVKLASKGLEWLKTKGVDQHVVALRARYHWIVQSACAVIACAIKGKSPDEIHFILADSPAAVSRALAKRAQASDLEASEGDSQAATKVRIKKEAIELKSNANPAARMRARRKLDRARIRRRLAVACPAKPRNSANVKKQAMGRLAKPRKKRIAVHTAPSLTRKRRIKQTRSRRRHHKLKNSLKIKLSRLLQRKRPYSRDSHPFSRAALKAQLKIEFLRTIVEGLLW